MTRWHCLDCGGTLRVQDAVYAECQICGRELERTAVGV